MLEPTSLSATPGFSSFGRWVRESSLEAQLKQRKRERDREGERAYIIAPTNDESEIYLVRTSQQSEMVEILIRTQLSNFRITLAVVGGRVFLKEQMLCYANNDTKERRIILYTWQCCRCSCRCIVITIS